MAYSKNVWVARQGTGLNRFEKQNETTTHVELVNDPTSVTTSGTAFNDVWMNNIEDGLEISIDTEGGQTIQGNLNASNYVAELTNNTGGNYLVDSTGMTSIWARGLLASASGNIIGGIGYYGSAENLTSIRIGTGDESTWWSKVNRLEITDSACKWAGYQVITTEGGQTIEGTLDVDGDFTVGDGFVASAGGQHITVGSASVPIRMKGTSNDPDTNTCYMRFQRLDGTNSGLVGYDSTSNRDFKVANNETGGVLKFEAPAMGSNYMVMGGTSSNQPYIRPTTSGTGFVGISAQRFDTIYATNGTINTSSESLKCGIAFLDGSTNPSYKMHDSVNDTYTIPTVEDFYNFVKDTYSPCVYVNRSDVDDVDDVRLDQNLDVLNIGFIAEDVESDDLYELFGREGDDGLQEIKDVQLLHLALSSIKELINKVETLETTVATLQSDISTLESDVSTLQSEVADHETRISALEAI